MKYDTFMDQLNELPHGSGIDCDWHIEIKKDKIYLINSYHYMNEFGYYMGYIDFTAIYSIKNDNMLYLDKIIFHTNSTGRYWIEKIDLRDYLYQILDI